MFQKRQKDARTVKSPPFEMSELENILKSLEIGKARDPEHLVVDIFKEGVIGRDLKESILMMLNNMKQQTFVP